MVDPHPVRRESVGFLIDRQSDLITCGSVTSAAEADDILQIVEPDLVTAHLGARPEDGDARKIRTLHAAHPALPILVVVRPPAPSIPGSLHRQLPDGTLSLCRVPADLLSSVRQMLVAESAA